MRVWHVYVSGRDSPVNGVTQAIALLATAQRDHGLDVELLDGGGTFAGLRSEVAFRRSHRNLPDVVHLHELFRPPHLGLGGLLRSVPYVVSTHGAASPANLARYRWRKTVYGRVVERRLVGGAAALVALTSAEQYEVRAWLPSTPSTRVIPNVADPALLDARAWEPPVGERGGQRLLTLSRWDVHHKGLDRLAEVGRLLPDVSIDVHGAPCGNEPKLLAQLRRTAPATLALVPPIIGPDHLLALRRASAFVLLSRWEGLSMALLEAMALGVPCLVSPEVAATLGPSAPVQVVPHDPAAGAHAVRAFLDDVPRRVAVGRAGRRWCERHASSGAVAEATAAIYREAVSATVPVGR